MPTLKLSDLGRSKIEQARIGQGWTSDDPRWLVKASKILEPSGEWCEGGPYACGCSEGTLKRFRRGKPVNTDTFKAFCEASKLVWQDVIEEFSINSLNDNHSSDGKTFQNPSKKLLGQMGSAHIGSIDLPDGNSMPIVLDVKELVHNHAAILAGDRDDKAQITRVLVEELLLPQNRAAVLLFDIDGRYETLTDLQANAAFKTEDGYAPKVKVVTSKDVRIRISSLDYYDILSLLPEMSDRQESILSKAYDLLRRHRRHQGD